MSRWLDKVKDDIKEKGLSAAYVIVHRQHIKVGKDEVVEEEEEGEDLILP